MLMINKFSRRMLADMQVMSVIQEPVQDSWVRKMILEGRVEYRFGPSHDLLKEVLRHLDLEDVQVPKHPKRFLEVRPGDSLIVVDRWYPPDQPDNVTISFSRVTVKDGPRVTLLSLLK